MKLGLIGYGAIGKAVVAGLLDHSPVPQITVMLRPGTSADLPTGVRAVRSLDDLLGDNPDLIVEAAGHSAVADYVSPCLTAGFDVLLASVGALADPDLERDLLGPHRDGGQLLLPSGAIGGLDMVAALPKDTIQSVKYQGTKPPSAWAGSPAAEGRNLSALIQPETLFTGTAREAALRFPKNANVAATLGLAGIGLDRTEVSLVADPAATGNRHSYEVASDIGTVSFSVEAAASSGNARTSATTPMSLLRAIRNRTARVAI